jgi:2-oxoglutarate dehydrogenase E2 component (dihydrolipoamide succinyltransferase)
MAVRTLKVPSPGESITEVQIAQWLKQDGDYVEKDEDLCEIDSDKATLTLTAEVSGKLHILVKEGETIEVGTEVCTIDDEAAAPEKKDAPPVPAQKTEPAAPPPAAPAPAAAGKKSAPAQSPKAKPEKKKAVAEDEKQESTAPSNPAEGNRAVHRAKMSMLRRKLSERLVAVKQQTAMLTTFNEVDMSAIAAIRSRHKEAFRDKHGVSLGFMSFFTRASCLALKQFPAVNSAIDGDEIITYDYCDIGIAVSAPKGLMVPVIRNAERLSFAGIEKQVADLAAKAREGKLTLEDMSDGTFTISNGGVFGSMLSTPILNPPQAAILGMHNIVERPVAINGKIEIRPVMYLALSYDHRLIDGRESVSFLVAIKRLLEEPARMLTGGKDPVTTLLDL